MDNEEEEEEEEEMMKKQETDRKFPSVLTLKSCNTNQMPIRSSGSVSLNAEAAKLPIKFRVYIPCGGLFAVNGLPGPMLISP